MATGGNITINDLTALTIAGNVEAGAGSAASGRSVTISAPGQTLTINGEVIGGPAGNVALSAETIVIAQQSGAAVPVIEADGSALLSANEFVQTAGVVNGGNVSITAAAGASVSNGQVVATQGTISAAGGAFSIGSGGTVAAVNGATDVLIASDLNQSADSLLQANRDIGVGGQINENGGLMLAARNISAQGLQQSAGTIAAGGAISIGTGQGVAGWSGSSATRGAFSQSGGAVVANGPINIFSSASFTQGAGAAVVTGSSLGVTATNDIALGGTLSAAGVASGFMVLTTAGNLSLSGLLGGPTQVTVGNALQAPSGTVQILSTAVIGVAGAVAAATTPVGGYTLACASCASQPPGAVPAMALPTWQPPMPDSDTKRIPLAVVGGAITVGGSITVSTLGLYAEGTIIQDPGSVIDATTLTGSAGGDVSLGGDNIIVYLGSFSAPGHTFTLNDDTDLALQGIITAKNVAITGGSSRITIDLGAGFAGLGGSSGSSSHPPVPGGPGLYLQEGNITNDNSSVSVAGAPSIDVTFALTGPGVVNLGYFRQPNVELFLRLANGIATGQIDVAGLTLEYGPATQSLTNLLGSVRGLSGVSASLVSFILPTALNNYQINGYPISIGNLGAVESTSINGLQNFRNLTSLPIINSLEDLQLGAMEQDFDDDTPLPDVADKDY